jgi:hypothetical protein
MEHIDPAQVESLATVLCGENRERHQIIIWRSGQIRLLCHPREDVMYDRVAEAAGLPPIHGCAKRVREYRQRRGTVVLDHGDVATLKLEIVSGRRAHKISSHMDAPLRGQSVDTRINNYTVSFLRSVHRRFEAGLAGHLAKHNAELSMTICKGDSARGEVFSKISYNQTGNKREKISHVQVTVPDQWWRIARHAYQDTPQGPAIKISPYLAIRLATRGDRIQVWRYVERRGRIYWAGMIKFRKGETIAFDWSGTVVSAS